MRYTEDDIDILINTRLEIKMNNQIDISFLKESDKRANSLPKSVFINSSEVYDLIKRVQTKCLEEGLELNLAKEMLI